MHSARCHHHHHHRRCRCRRWTPLAACSTCTAATLWLSTVTSRAQTFLWTSTGGSRWQASTARRGGLPPVSMRCGGEAGARRCAARLPCGPSTGKGCVVELAPAHSRALISLPPHPTTPTPKPKTPNPNPLTPNPNPHPQSPTPRLQPQQGAGPRGAGQRGQEQHRHQPHLAGARGHGGGAPHRRRRCVGLWPGDVRGASPSLVFFFFLSPPAPAFSVSFFSVGSSVLSIFACTSAAPSCSARQASSSPVFAPLCAVHRARLTVHCACRWLCRTVSC